MKKFTYEIKIDHLSYNIYKTRLKNLLNQEFTMYEGDTMKIQYSLDIPDCQRSVDNIDKTYDHLKLLLTLSDKNNPKYDILCDYLTVIEEIKKLQDDFHANLHILNDRLQLVEVDDEDFWIPIRPNSQTKIDTLPGAQNLSDTDDEKINIY